MSVPLRSPGRFAAELAIGSVFVLAGITVTGLGVAQWLVTILQATYPCGETYQIHPSCRLADPGLAGNGYLLTIVVPAACTLAGVVVGVVTFARWRSAALPAALAFAIALTAFLTGRAMIDTALGRIVPW